MGGFTWNKYCNEYHRYGNFNEMYQSSKREYMKKRSDLTIEVTSFFIYLKNKFADRVLLLIFQPLLESAGSEQFRVRVESVARRLYQDRRTC